MSLFIVPQDELETHSKPDSISVFVHYGGERANDPKVIAEPDVVLTTYGVLTSAYKNVSILKEANEQGKKKGQEQTFTKADFIIY